MKVLFISSWYPNSTNALKGIYVKKHAQAIQSGGAEIRILALTVSPSKKIFEKKAYRFNDETGLITHVIELNSRFYKVLHLDLLLQFTFLKKYFYKVIAPEFTPDVIHSNVLYPAAIMGNLLAKKLKKPHVITEHWSQVDKFLSKSLYAGLGRKAYLGAKFVTAVSGFLKNSLSKHIPSEKIMIVPNVVNTEMFSFKEKPLTGNSIVFSCAAHWGRPKRPDLIFKALQEVSGHKTEGVNPFNKKIILNVVGEGHLINELKKTKWDFDVNYLGNVEPKRLAGILQSSNYFLHASDMETFSIVIAEALSTGTPVLASGVGAVSELINSTNGLLCENSVKDWVDSLKELISKKDFDGNLISKNSLRFNKKNIGAEFLKLYKETLGLNE